ncbi:MAG: hypothetical protein M3Z03_10325, partial [Actinomycetota bacterium]|nr:hypothetical protein [Actinomycetota bacterium]
MNDLDLPVDPALTDRLRATFSAVAEQTPVDGPSTPIAATIDLAPRRLPRRFAPRAAAVAAAAAAAVA